MTGPEAFGPADAELIAIRAVRAALPRADPGDLRLLRLGSNAVFTVGDIVVRIPSPGTHPNGVRRTLALARWLAATDFPTVRALPDARLAVPQPIDVDGRPVTFWERVRASGRGTPHDLGLLLRRFHALPPPPVDLPALDLVGRCRTQLATAPLDGADRELLRGRLADLTARFDRLTFPLPAGHLHGDAILDNVAVDGSGRAVLLDLDLARTGAREWDLVRTAVYAVRLGWLTAAEHADVATAYGVDVTAWEGFDVLADLGELLQVSWLADAARHRPSLAAELHHRVATIRTGAPRTTWRAV